MFGRRYHVSNYKYLINTSQCGKNLYSLINTNLTKLKLECKNVVNLRNIRLVCYDLLELLFFSPYSIRELLTKITKEAIQQSDIPSETKRSAFYNGVGKNQTEFNDWLVGLTDGDGTFYFLQTNKKGVWGFTFKIGQSNYNLRLLFYIKSILKIGSISVPNSKDNMAEYRIRNIQHIIHYILPVFDNHPLLSSKYYKYSLFKKAILITANNSLTKDKKDHLISKLKEKSLNGIPLDYVSPAWKLINNTVNSNQDADKVMNKLWLIGFTEAEGSFYIVKKGPRRLVHAFEITPKLDVIVLEAIAKIFHVKVTKKKNI